MGAMGENVAALAGNRPDTYERRRLGGEGMALDPMPTTAFRHAATLQALLACWANQPDRPMAVLDVGGGPALLPVYAHDLQVPIVYHATEQSEAVCAAIRSRAAPGDAPIAAAVWRFEPDGEPLRDALARAADVFLPTYPVVLASHILEHVADPYAFLDQCWDMVAEGGYLVLVVPRNHTHRLHFRLYDWDTLLATVAPYAGFGAPLITWDYDYWTDLFVAVPKVAAHVREAARAVMTVARVDAGSHRVALCPPWTVPLRDGVGPTFVRPQPAPPQPNGHAPEPRPEPGGGA